MSAVREALEALGHSAGALPEPRLLADLFGRFQAQVPLRRAPEGFGADEALASWLDSGGGCCGELRVLAFEVLAISAGFAVEAAWAQGPTGESHRVLLAHGRRVLLDPAFPLPTPLSLDPPEEGQPTGYGRLSARGGPGNRFEILLEARGDERVLYRVEPGEAHSVCESAGASCRHADSGGLFRLLDDRLLRWRSGVLEISDDWSRFRMPFAASDGEGLAAFFGPPLPELVPSEEEKPSVPGPTLSVYHASAAEVPSLKGLLADPVGNAALLPKGWTVEDLSVREGGFARTLVEEGTFLRTERVAVLPDGITVEAHGPLALFRSRTWRLEPRPSGTRLRLLATLRDPVPPRGLPEGTRRRLVFELASELLALDALAATG